ncbi:glycosyltransferase family 39 protein [Aestuariibacter sp. A3R04]|uniref:ArnT family glycosyltransferase n=1 Tax=Aestuariibacter sp. A3R04 TaxID=2841571 RepID=UPI001C09470E|nr:glycosyltransferase family 39 protein [Aestuariibacter sp. A3R04]MBU3022027.1 glycosyltransferase family 39 protein [Aestuariibacter sp. A3R04]
MTLLRPPKSTLSNQQLRFPYFGRFLSSGYGLIVIASVLIFSGIGLRDAWPPDEPRFVLVAKSMVETGQWLIPMRGNEIYPDKPPFFMWTIALIYAVSGSLKVAMLLPNAIASSVTLALTYRLSVKLSDEHTAKASVLVLLLCPQFLIQAKFAQIDAMVACFIWIAIYGFIQHFFLTPHWRWYFISWFFMGLGVITKGVGFLPVLLLLPIAFYTLKHQITAAAWRKRAMLGPLVMLLVILLWLAPVLYLGLIKQDVTIQHYLSNILLKQTAQRYTHAWHHIEPWYYFLSSVIPLFWLPAVAILFAHIKHFGEHLAQKPAYASLFIWAVLVVIFFSISPGKRGVYILPALPALAMTAGSLLTRFGTPVLLLRAAVVLTAGLSILSIGAGTVLFFDTQISEKLMVKYQADRHIVEHIGALCLFVGGLGLASFAVYSQRLRASFSTQLVIWLSALVLPVSTCGAWLLNPYRTPVSLLAKVENYLPAPLANTELAIVDFKEQYLLYAPFPLTHFGYHTPKEHENGAAWSWLKGSQVKARFLLVPESYHFRCINYALITKLGIAHRETWLLVPAAAASPHCSLPTGEAIYLTN